MNELEEWCVPDNIKWGDVEDYVAMAIAEATIKPMSQIGIGEWISNALVVKWPCDNVVDNSVVTDPELIKRLNEAYRQAQEEADD